MDAGDGDDARARARTDLVESEHDTWIRGRSEANPDSVLEAEGRIKPPSSLDINQDYKDPFPVRLISQVFFNRFLNFHFNIF